MCQVNNATMEETYKAEVVCLRKVLAEKDKEVAQLKELLKECKPYISYYININKYVGWTPPSANLLAKIKEATGEKK